MVSLFLKPLILHKCTGGIYIASKAITKYLISTCVSEKMSSAQLQLRFFAREGCTTAEKL